MKNVKHLLIVLFTIFLSGLTLLAIPQHVAESGDLTTTPTPPSECQAILAQAFVMLHQTCSEVGRNRACYGNNDVNAQLTAGTVSPFSTPGDKLPIQVIKLLSTSPLDIVHQTWGLSLLKLQANIPDTLPGQNVLFLVYGDTSVTNQSGDMRSFYVASGLNTPTCKDVPADGVVVHSPDHLRVTFTVNGVQMSIASTIIIRATANKNMTVQLIEGNATVTAPLGAQTLKPGQMVTIQMGGTTGLDPISAPSQPAQSILEPSMIDLLTTSQTIDDPQKTTNFTLTGCISTVEGEIATIYGYRIRIKSDTAGFKTLNVGDCLEINGNLTKDIDDTVLVDAVDLTYDPSPSIAGGVGNLKANSGSSSNSGNSQNKGGNGNNGNGGSHNSGGGNNGNGNGNSNSNSGNNGNGNNGNGNNGNGNGNNGNGDSAGMGNMGGMGGMGG